MNRFIWEKGHYYEHVNLDTSSLLLNLFAFGPRGVDKLSDDDKTNILKIVDGRLADAFAWEQANTKHSLSFCIQRIQKGTLFFYLF